MIITFNEQNNIVECIRSAKTVSSDIIVADSGSTDDTCSLAIALGARVININWEGYGNARNAAAAAAKNDWILALDADERLTPALGESIGQVDPDAGNVYGMRRANFCEGKQIRFGSFGSDKVFRLYNRLNCAWDTTPVHEEVTGYNTRSLLNGWLHHYTITNRKQYEQKLDRYAILNADKYFSKGKKAGWVKRYVSPLYGFIKGYIFQLGFLDGSNGYWVAKVHARYTARKYEMLHQIKRLSPASDGSKPSDAYRKVNE